MKVLILYCLNESSINMESAYHMKEELNVDCVLIFEADNKIENIQYPYIDIIEF